MGVIVSKEELRLKVKKQLATIDKEVIERLQKLSAEFVKRAKSNGP